MYEQPGKGEWEKYVEPERVIRPPIAWGSLAVQWLVGLAMLAIGVHLMLAQQVRQAEYNRILSQGVGTLAVVDEAYVRDATDDEGAGRCFLVVRYYTDGRPGPPRRAMSPFPDFGGQLPGMPIGKDVASPGSHMDPLPFDMEVSKEDGRIVLHPVCVGKKEVSRKLYEATTEGQAVAVKYLQSAPQRFVIVEEGGPKPSQMWWIVTWMGLIGMAMAWRFWRTYVR
jgi:hypothetical protein